MRMIKSGINSFMRIPTSINEPFSKKIFFLFNGYYDSRPFGIFRTSLALIGIGFIIQNWADLPFLYGRDGIISGEINDVIAQQTTLSLKHISNFFQQLFSISELASIKIILLIKILFLGCLLIGFKPNLIALVCWLLDYSSISSSFLLSYGYDMIYDNCLLFCVFLPIGSSPFKLNMDQSTGIKNWYKTATWLLRAHLGTIYLFSGLNKMMGHDWWSGEAIWRAVMQPPLQKLDFSFLAHYPAVPFILSISTLIIETFYPLLIYFKKTRTYFFCMVIGMHLFIAVAMNLFYFSLLMIMYNIVIWSTYYFAEKGSIRIKRSTKGIEPSISWSVLTSARA